MQFTDVIGQEAVKRQLRRMWQEGRMPHALLLAGPEGCGKLPMALALATRLLCRTPNEADEACGVCRDCKMTAKWAHPDLHFIFPVFNAPGQSGRTVSDRFLTEWRTQLDETPYFTRQAWLKRIGVENQQSLIGVAEANNLLSKLFTVSSQGGYRIVIIWLAEQMNQEAANKLLKILEEPPAGTIFILTANEPERMLPTILSRTQRIDMPPLSEAEIATALRAHFGLNEEDAHTVARSSDGSYIQAIAQATVEGSTAHFFDMFTLFMRTCYMRDVKKLYEWSVQVAGWGREEQKAYLEYCQHLIRENFVYNFHDPRLNYMNREEGQFAVRFARYINERNVIDIMDELAAAQRDIAQNVNARMVFFDLSLKMIVYLLR